MKYKFNQLLVRMLAVAAFILVPFTAYASKSDKIIFADASCTIPADHPENPFGFPIKIALGDGIIKTTVDGSTSDSDLMDLTAGPDVAYSLVTGENLGAVPLDHVCLSVQGNVAIVWQKFNATIPNFVNEGDLMLVRYVDNGNRTGTVKFRNLGNIPVPNACSQSDESYLQDAQTKPTVGIMIKDGI